MMFTRSLPLAFVLVVLALLTGTAEASHISGYDLSHEIAPDGTVTFTYELDHSNCRKFPSVVCPSTGGKTLNFGDNQSGSASAEIVSGGPPDCGTPCRITYRDCTDPLDADSCDTATTTRIYTHTYSGCGPYIANTSDRARLRGILNTNSSDIRPRNTVTPCCLNQSGDPNSGPALSADPVRIAFQDFQYLHPIGASDPDGDPLAIQFLTQSVTNISCQAPCFGSKPLPSDLTAVDVCETPSTVVMDLVGDQLDWDQPNSGSGCDRTRQGLYAVAVAVEDTCGATAQRDFLLELLPPSQTNPNDPELIVTPQTSLIACVDMDTVIINLDASDVDVGQIVNLTVTPSGFVETVFSTAPGNPTSGVFTFTPTTGGAGIGNFGFTFSAQDDGTPIRTALEAVDIEVIQCSRAPISNPGGPYILECDGDPTRVPVDGSLSTDPDGDPITYQWSTNCPGGIFDDNTLEQPTLSLDGPPSCPVVCRVTLKVDDGLFDDTRSRSVIVRDTTNPVLTRGAIDNCYPDVAAAEAGVIATTLAVDSCNAPTKTATTIGECAATVTVVGTDECGNATEMFYDMRIDDTPPTISIPAALTIECTEPGGSSASEPAIRNWLQSALANDNCGLQDFVNDAPSFFDSGCGGNATVVEFTATDECSVELIDSSTLTVEDTTPPTVTKGAIAGCYASVADAEAAAIAATTASDICSTQRLTTTASTVGTCNATIDVLVEDDCGNGDTVSYTTKVDGAGPTISLPADVTLECSGTGGIPAGDPQIQSWLNSASASDNCNLASFGNDAPTFFASGCGGNTTTVTFDATDDCGNLTRATATITVIDTAAPDMKVPAPLNLECNGVGGVPMTDPEIQRWLALAKASDTCDGGSPAITNDAPALFASGCVPGTITTVTFEATDSCGNVASLTSTVTVVDTTPPVLDVPAAITLECNGVGGVLETDPQVQDWLGKATAFDDCEGAPMPITNDVPSLFPSGCVPGTTTTVTFESEDPCGNKSVETSTITVVDTVPPVLTAEDIPVTCLWPPNHKYFCIDDLKSLAVATDLCDDDVIVVALSCTSNQPDDAKEDGVPGNGDGHTTNDCKLINNDRGVCLRSERLGTDPAGRIYTISMRATDECNNSNVIDFEIAVPHDSSPKLSCERPNSGK